MPQPFVTTHNTLHHHTDFGVVHEAASNHAASSGSDHGTLFTGLAIYAVTMAFLTLWEEFAVPTLTEKGMLPNIPGSLTDIKRRKGEVFRTPWVTPLTANTGGMPLPSLSSLMKKAYRVGKSNGIVQYIRAHASVASSSAAKGGQLLMESLAQGNKALEPIPIESRVEEDSIISDELGVCRLSPDWTDHYGHAVYICKRPE